MAALTLQNLDRLAKAMMEPHGVSYARAMEMLGELKLHLICGEEIRTSVALQAALLTSINTGKRAFHGGVTIDLPKEVRLQLPWPEATNLNDVARNFGALETEVCPARARSLVFGQGEMPTGGLRVVCDGWRGGVVPVGFNVTFHPDTDFALGGVFAGAFAVGRTFLSAAKISHRDVVEPTGISLWRPDLCWLSCGAGGPSLQGLPAKLWLLGLGHLGQAYTWTLGLLPFAKPALSTFFLQDFDEVESGNWSAALLCEMVHVGKLKTRLTADWLEERGFRTRMIERPFDGRMMRNVDEPRIALCGFDNPESRRLLEDVGFELIIECGLGATVDRFDRIVLHTFPSASAGAHDIWAHDAKGETSPLDLALFEEPKGECGILLQDIAGKAISASFSGACASALVVAEILRAIHGGERREFLTVQLRDLELPGGLHRAENYQLCVAKNGIVAVAGTLEDRLSVA